jgi:hypothetical protein
MAMKSVGPISLGEIQTEFGGSPYTALSEYYYKTTDKKWPTGYSGPKQWPQATKEQLPHSQWVLYNLSDHYAGEINNLEITGSGGEVAIDVSTSSTGADSIRILYFGNNSGGTGSTILIKNIQENKLYIKVTRTDPPTYGAKVTFGLGWANVNAYVTTSNGGKIPGVGTNKFSNYYGAKNISLYPKIDPPRVWAFGANGNRWNFWYRGAGKVEPQYNKKWVNILELKPNIWVELFGGVPKQVVLFGTGREVEFKVKTEATGPETTICSFGNNKGPASFTNGKTGTIDNRALYNSALFKTITLNDKGDLYIYSSLSDYDGDADVEGGWIHAVSCIP